MTITLKNLASATKQQIFDQVAVHLLTQMFQSRGQGGTCFYRGVGGLKCAAGCLIADDEYTLAMDTKGDFIGTGWRNLVTRGLVPQHDNSEFIRALQNIHDQEPPEGWKKALELFAIDNELNTEAIDKM